MNAIAIALLALSAPPQEPSPDLAEVVAAVREAVGAGALERLGGAVRLQGEADLFGLSGTHELLFTPDGRFRQRFTAPELSHASGFDGERCWELDFTGMPLVLELEDRETLLASKWVLTGRWLAADGPFELELLEPRGEGGLVVLGLNLRNGRLHGEVHVDPLTWLPRAFLREGGQGTSRWVIGEYGRELGVALPRRYFLEAASGEVYRFEYGAAEALASEEAADLVPSLERPDDTRFDPAVPSRIELRRARTGHLLVHPRLEGRDVGWFILDSGAGASCIDPEVAGALELPGFGRVAALGIGGVVEASFRRGTRFELGPVRIADPVYVELELSFLDRVFGVEVAGICGYDLFSRAVVTLDLEGERVELHDPSRYRLPADREPDTAWRELVLDSRLPCVRARFEGDREGVFRIDTGATGTVTFAPAAVRRHGLLEGREVKTSVQGGAGGVVFAKEGVLEWFELAGHRFERPTVSFSQADVGALVLDYTAGTLGGAFLAPFEVVFDYPHRRIAFLARNEPGPR